MADGVAFTSRAVGCFVVLWLLLSFVEQSHVAANSLTLEGLAFSMCGAVVRSGLVAVSLSSGDMVHEMSPEAIVARCEDHTVRSHT